MGKLYPIEVPVPVYPKTPKCVLPTSRNDIAFHVGTETEATTSKTVPAKQKKKPGKAGDTILTVVIDLVRSVR